MQRLAVLKTGKLHALGTVQELRESVNLPLVIKLRHHCLQGILQSSLLGIILESSIFSDTTAEIRCHRAQKMEVLHRLAMLSELEDIIVREPSLEDVFLGYAV